VTHKLASIERFDIFSRGPAFVVESPVTAPRERAAYLAAIGDIEIDGVPRKIVGIEWKVPAYPVQVGERICLIVSP
jgi:hypothetical protein